MQGLKYYVGPFDFHFVMKFEWNFIEASKYTVDF